MLCGLNKDDRSIVLAEVVVKKAKVTGRGFVRTDNVNQQVDSALKQVDEAIKVAQNFPCVKG